MKTNTSSRAAALPRAFSTLLFCAAATVLWAMPGTANAATAVWGTYPNPTTVKLGANTTVTPTSPPQFTTNMTVSTSTNFKGRLEGDRVTGVVRVTNAHPAGTYPVTVTAFNGAATATRTFTLTVTTPPTCNPIRFGAASFGAATAPIFTAVGDFNGDGKQDLAVANDGSNNVSILLNNGAIPPSFTPATGSPFAVFGEAFAVAVGDFDGDGDQDLAVGNRNSTIVSVLLNNGAGTFGAPNNVTVGNNPLSVAVGDFNGDGRPDLATANQSSNNTSILLGNGTGGFTAAAGSPFAAGSTPSSVAVGDFNGNGNQDLAFSNFNTGTVSVLLGDGTGSFSAAVGSPFAAGTNPRSVVVGDFNGDSMQDIAIPNSNNDNVSVLLGNGLGGFPTTTSFLVNDFPISIAVGDFNGDGKQDLVTANTDSNNVSLLLNITPVGGGTAMFATHTEFPVGMSPRSVAVGDFNGDGMQDLSTANAGSSNDVSVLLRQCAVVPCVQPPSSMVAWWPLDETSGGVVVDIAGVNTNNGSAIPGPIGPPTFPASVSAEVGPGLEFPAATVPNPGPLGYVEVPSDPEVNFGTSDFTIDAWIKPTNQNNIQPIVDKLDFNAPPNKGYAFFVQSGKLFLRIGPDNSGGLVGAVSTGSVTYGVWNHVAVTVRRSDPNVPNNPVVTFYINGVLGGSGPPPGPGMNPTNNINGATPLWIGGNSRLGNVSLGDIVIDELEFFKRELVQQEIQNIYNAGPGGKCKCVQVPSGFTLWLPFDETSGTTSANLYTGGNNGTQTNNPTVTNGYVDHSLCFDGATQSVNVPDYAAINPGAGNLSIDAWVKRDPASGNSPPRIIVDKRAANGVGYSLAVSFGNLLFQLNDGVATNYRDTGVVPADNQWHFVAVTVNRTSTTGGQFYVDCNPTGMFNPTDRPNSLNNTGAFQVGASVVGGNSPWLGCIDEVEFFPRVLTPTEIQSICNAGSVGKCKPVPTVVSAVSRKILACGTFDIPLPLNCPSGVECRSGGTDGDYMMVVHFSGPVTFLSIPQAEIICHNPLAGTGCVGSGNCDPTGMVAGLGSQDITVPLHNVSNAQTITVRINGVNGTTNNVTIPMGILIGDTTGNGAVTSSDVAQTKLCTGQVVDGTNFRCDVNMNCVINGTDVSIVKANVGTAITRCCP